MELEYFKIFGIEPLRLHLTESELEKKYHELALNEHPDKKLDSDSATAKTAKVNLAYKTLKDPWKRAHYFIGSRSPGSKMPTHLAELMFELEDVGDHEALDKFYSELKEREKKAELRLNEIFKSFDQDTLEREKYLSQMGELVLERPYLQSMMRDLELKLKKL